MDANEIKSSIHSIIDKVLCNYRDKYDNKEFQNCFNGEDFHKIFLDPALKDICDSCEHLELLNNLIERIRSKGLSNKGVSNNKSMEIHGYTNATYAALFDIAEKSIILLILRYMYLEYMPKELVQHAAGPLNIEVEKEQPKLPNDYIRPYEPWVPVMPQLPPNYQWPKYDPQCKGE